MIKKILVIGIFVYLLTGCVEKNIESKLTVTVSIVPQQFFVNQIAGNWLYVNVMVPSGSSPATYEPTPQQMRDLSNSELYIKIGHIGFEKAWMNRLVSVNPKLKFIDTSEGLDLIVEEEWGEAHDHNHGHSHEGYNPHIWLSPQLVKKQAEIIFKALSSTYPQYADSMQLNLDKFIAKCDSVQQKLNSQLKQAEGTAFIVYHPVWNYLARDYNLKQVSIEHNGKEATADKLKNIIDFAKEKNIKIIVAQKEFSDAQVQTIAKEIGGKVVLLNPLEYNWFHIMKKFGNVFDSGDN
ncbi:MAG: zinc ABC transporter substrate-binding protein [Salinivirgaceae bacterium]|jgi:zinc transport system substrate-binding protein|nr:zinc ABC transporter substrate-binding protein [Salinivirgaceae bacterium]